jgi:hypothetical protein
MFVALPITSEIFVFTFRKDVGTTETEHMPADANSQVHCIHFNFTIIAYSVSKTGPSN